MGYNQGKNNPMYGKIPWNKGKKLNLTEEHKEKLRKHLEDWRKNHPSPWLGRKHTPEEIEKIRKGNLGKKCPYAIKNLGKYIKGLKGKENPNWRGGTTKKIIKWWGKHRQEKEIWRKKVLERDGYKCKLCGKTKRLEAHHIIPVSETTLTAFLEMNGITLCRECHKKTESYGGRIKGIRNKKEGIGKTKWLIRTIPQEFQVFRDVGNYQLANKDLIVIFVSEMENPDYEFLVTLHEFIESYLLKRRGIDLKEIDKWENKFEQEKKEGKRPKKAVAGEQKDCPYKKEHAFATKIEKMVAKYLKVNWGQYDKYLDYLLESYVQKPSNSR